MTLLLDFDGTLCPGPYTSRFECNGEPTPEAKAAVQAYRDAGIEVIIFTARLSDVIRSQRITSAIQEWTAEHFDGWKPEVTCIKYPGVILDDNAIRFDGKHWPTVEQIQGHGTFTSPDEYIPEPDWKQAFMDAMEILDAQHRYMASWLESKEAERLRALRDAAKGEANG